jgi:hypothetical protein
LLESTKNSWGHCFTIADYQDWNELKLLSLGDFLKNPLSQAFWQASSGVSKRIGEEKRE